MNGEVAQPVWASGKSSPRASRQPQQETRVKLDNTYLCGELTSAPQYVDQYVNEQ